MVMRIKRLRVRAEMTQNHLAADMGVSANTIIAWEKETYLPKARDLPRLASVLGCSIGQLFVEEAV